jgi:hypothetical protein
MLSHLRNTKNSLPLLLVLVAGIGAGLVTGAFASSRDQANPTDGQWTTAWPDGRIDVCVRGFEGATADPTDVINAVESLDDTEAGVSLDLSEVETTATAQCQVPLPVDLDSGERVSMALPRNFVTERGPFDLVIHVVPQATADGLGAYWADRITGQEYLRGEASDSLVFMTPALFIGDGEAADAGTLRRTVAIALGLGGPLNDLRPRIDGLCVEPGNPECGPDIAQVES